MKIETAIPIPPAAACYVGKGKWADVAESLAPGQSLLLEDKKHAHCLYMALERIGRPAVWRKVNGEGIRIWHAPNRSLKKKRTTT